MPREWYIAGDQSQRCYEDFRRIVRSISSSRGMRQFSSLEHVERYLRSLPFRADTGGSNDCRCTPPQRFRQWPSDINCWESSGHYAAAWLMFDRPAWEQLWIFDSVLPNAGGERHMFPALLDPRTGTFELHILDGEPVRTVRANEWYNDLLGLTHVVGSVVLSVFGAGALAPQLEKVEGDALPDWARSSTPPHNPPAPQQQRPQPPPSFVPVQVPPGFPPVQQQPKPPPPQQPPPRPLAVFPVVATATVDDPGLFRRVDDPGPSPSNDDNDEPMPTDDRGQANSRRHRQHKEWT